MKKIVASLLIAITPLFMFAAPTTMNLSDAIMKGVVKMEGVSTGNYKGKAIKLTITNNGGSSIELNIDLGMILKPENPAFQPLVLAGEETLTLKSHATESIDVNVFCDNSVKACPIEGLHYSYLRLCGDELMKVLRFVHGHKLFDHLGQAAVWAISNYHTLNSVYDPNRDSVSRKLISYISEVTRRPKPNYYTTSTDNDVQAQVAYVNRIDKFYVPFEMSLAASTSLSAFVVNQKGEQVKTIFVGQPHEAGKQNIMTRFDALGMEPGKYTVRIMDGEKMLLEKEVTIGL